MTRPGISASERMSPRIRASRRSLTLPFEDSATRACCMSLPLFESHCPKMRRRYTNAVDQSKVAAMNGPMDQTQAVRDMRPAPLPSRVSLVEVGPRDGLQAEAEWIPTATKIDLVNGLIDAGLRHLEVTSFVSPRAVPQLRDAA